MAIIHEGLLAVQGRVGELLNAGERVVRIDADPAAERRALQGLVAGTAAVAADEPARAALRDSELQRAQAVWARKFGQLPASAAERGRQMRFLAARGFSADTVRAVLRGAGCAEAAVEADGGDQSLPAL
jgi:hypothetical protein